MTLNNHCVVILSRNRAKILEETIIGLKPQLNTVDRVYISDNSTDVFNSELVKSIALKYGIPVVENKGLTMAEHYHKILISEKESYVTILHDDDIPLPGFITTTRTQLKINPGISLLATNGRQFNEQVIDGVPKKVFSKNLEFRSQKEIIELKNESDLILNWISPISLGTAPLSSYTFKTLYYKINHFETYSLCGLYWDTILISQFAESASIIWINKSLLQIRDHADRATYDPSCKIDSESVAKVLKQRYSKNKLIARTCDYFISTRRLNSLKREKAPIMLISAYLRWITSYVIFILFKPDSIFPILSRIILKIKH